MNVIVVFGLFDLSSRGSGSGAASVAGGNHGTSTSTAGAGGGRTAAQGFNYRAALAAFSGYITAGQSDRVDVDTQPDSDPERQCLFGGVVELSVRSTNSSRSGSLMLRPSRYCR